MSAKDNCEYFCLGLEDDENVELSCSFDITVPMKNPDATIEESYHIRYVPVTSDYDRVHNIMDAKYEPADLRKYVRTCMHLTLNEQNALY